MRVSNTLPGQLARSTAREMALSRSRAPRPFITAPRGAGLAGFALAIANEAWNLSLQQDIPVPAADYAFPGTTPGQSYRLSFSITWRRELQPPFDVLSMDSVSGFLMDGSVLALGFAQNGDLTAFRQLRGEADGTVTYVLIGGRNKSVWRLVGLNSLSVTPDGSPGTLLPSSVPGLEPEDGQPDPLGIPLTLSLPGGLSGQPAPMLIPIRIPNPSQLGERPVPILYDPSIPEERRRNLPQMWLTPQGIQVGRGSQGDPITTTPGDTIVTITNTTSTNDFRLRNPPTVTTCTPDPEPSVDCCDCDDIRQIVIEELDSKFPPSRPFSNEVILLAAAESRTFVLPEFTQWVELTIVVPPPNRRSQFGGAAGQTVYYNGWYSFGATGSTSERYPFHYDLMSIPIPKGVEAFTYTVYVGGTASGRIGYQLPSLL